MLESKQITDQELRRSAEVAKLCYSLAKTKYAMSEEDARAMYMLGWNANIGYAFDPKHPGKVGALIAAHAFPETAGFAEAIHDVGRSMCEHIYERILNEADMSVDLTGKVMGFTGRLAELAVKYGKDSMEYLSAKKQIEILEILEPKTGAQSPSSTK